MAETNLLTSLISDIKQNNDYDEKTQMIAMIYAFLKSKRIKLTDSNKALISDFIISEMKSIGSLVAEAKTYKEKSLIFMYTDKLFALIMTVHQNPAEISLKNMEIIKNTSQLMEKEMHIEKSIDDIFSQKIVSIVDVKNLLKTLSESTDEYEKGLLYAGLLHYRENLPHLLESSKEELSSYIAAEMVRYINLRGALSKDAEDALEHACDICKYFINDSIKASLREVMTLGKNNLSFYSVSSLLAANEEIPQDIINTLAGDLIYADNLYGLLHQHNKTERFPTELANEEYLAKSDLVHWLTYPTELGKAPDEIEYIGKTDVKKESFYIFKFKSDSDTLSEEQKSKWLIGWSSNEGGTFSNFDEYEKFDKGTPEKTVKYIKKKLL